MDIDTIDRRYKSPVSALDTPARVDYISPYLDIGVGSARPKIVFDHMAYRKFRAFIDNCQDEISGLGFVESVDGVFHVKDVVLLKQQVSAATTDLDSGAISAYMLECINSGIDVSKLKLWWHSHAAMNVFWSGTDDDTIAGLSNSWMLSIVGNHKGDVLARVDVYEPLRITVDVQGVEYSPCEDQKFTEAIKSEISSKVTRKTYEMLLSKPELLMGKAGGVQKPVQSLSEEDLETARQTFSWPYDY
jgi:hypothetical protein